MSMIHADFTGNEEKLMKVWKPLEIFPLNQPQLSMGKSYKRCLKKNVKNQSRFIMAVLQTVLTQARVQVNGTIW